MTMSQPLTLEQLLHRVRTQPEWALPEFVGTPNPQGWKAMRWLWRGLQVLMGLQAVALWAQLLQHHTRWAAVLGVAAVVGALAWWRYRTPRDRALGDPLAPLHAPPGHWRGCVVEVAPRTVRTFGLRTAQQWQLTPPQEWSLGLLEHGSVNHHGESGPVLTCVLELRHVRRGPVVVLSTLLLDEDNAQVRQQVEALLDAMAQRLGIRRSGQGLSGTVAERRQ